MIKEDPANAAPLSPVGQIEVVIADLLKARIELWIMQIAGLFERSMKMGSIGLDQVSRREI